MTPRPAEARRKSAAHWRSSRILKNILVGALLYVAVTMFVHVLKSGLASSEIDADVPCGIMAVLAGVIAFGSISIVQIAPVSSERKSRAGPTTVKGKFVSFRGTSTLFSIFRTNRVVGFGP